MAQATLQHFPEHGGAAALPLLCSCLFEQNANSKGQDPGHTKGYVFSHFIQSRVTALYKLNITNLIGKNI